MFAEGEWSHAPGDLAPVVLIGSSCFDIKGTVPDAFHPGTSNPGRVRISLGGTARNIAENLARLDVPTRLLTAVGDDELGRQIVRRTRAAGVVLADDQLVISDRLSTGAYLALLEDDGQLIAGLDDTQVAHCITPRHVHGWRRYLREASLVVVDANLRPQTIGTVVRLCQRYGVGVCLDPVSVSLSARIAPYLDGAVLTTPNMREAAALAGRPVATYEDALLAARRLQDQGVGTVVVTMARAGAVYVDAEASGRVPALDARVVDATGAGDAMTSGVIFGMLNGFPLDEAVGFGAAMAALTMDTSQTVRSDLTIERVYDHLPG
jgi:pseudouridine kinase